MIITKCLNCGKEIRDFPCKKRIYCSRRCHRLHKPPMHQPGAKEKLSKKLKGRKITWAKKISKTRITRFKEGKIKPYWTKQKGKLITGKNNPNWKGGVSYIKYPKEFFEKRPTILKRDNFICQLCADKIIIQSKERFISIHHIDYNKKNNSLNNLITLCNICNSQVNANRQYWTNHFQEVLKSL